jgi:hypothetical protein
MSSGERQQQLEREVRQRDLRAIAHHLVSAHIDAQIASLVDLFRNVDGGIQDAKPQRVAEGAPLAEFF